MIPTTARTAIARRVPSAPARLLASLGTFEGKRVLDYGCGRGMDAEHFEFAGRWDPHFHSALPSGLFDVVLLTYVLNVLPEDEALRALDGAAGYLSPDGAVYATVRRDVPQGGRGVQRFVAFPNRFLFYESRAFAIYRFVGWEGHGTWEVHSPVQKTRTRLVRRRT